MLRRTFSSLGCPELDLDGALALVAKHGLDGAELRVLGGTIDLPAYFTAQFGSPAALAAKLGAEARRIVALDTSLKLIGNTPAEREQFLRRAERWKAMSPNDRAAWRRLVEKALTSPRKPPFPAEETMLASPPR
jgi:sugar phosphate isomerase/epimerase